MELIRQRAGLLDAAVIIAGYLQKKYEYEQRDCARELIATQNCAICLLHMVEDECCGMLSCPLWHGEFLRHMKTRWLNQLLWWLDQLPVHPASSA